MDPRDVARRELNVNEIIASVNNNGSPRALYVKWITQSEVQMLCARGYSCKHVEGHEYLVEKDVSR
jgi:hypothetical protein